MTLKAAIDSIARSTTNDACKRIAMGGYFFRSEVSTTAGSEGNFTLTFRKRDNDGSDDQVDYVFSYTALTGKWSAPSTKPDLTGELFGELIGDDWIVGRSSDFESARIPDPGDEW